MTPESLAKSLLEDGASYTEVARTLKMHRTTLRKKLPGYGWTQAQGGAYGYMVRKANERMELR